MESELAPLLGGPEALSLRDPPCGNQPCHRRQLAYWQRAQLVAQRLRSASEAQPSRTVAELVNRCGHVGPSSVAANTTRPQSARPKILRVPKSASSFFLTTMANGCNESRRDPIVLGEHQAPPSDNCGQITLATLREPCDRFVSIYRQFESTYASDNALCSYYAGLCRKHWLRKAKNVSDFFYLTRARWISILGAPSATLTDQHAGRGVDDKLYLPAKYSIHAMPQSLWIGNFTVVLCVTDGTGERMVGNMWRHGGLRDEVVHVRHELKCRGKPSSLLLVGNTSGHMFNAHKPRSSPVRDHADEAATGGVEEASRYTLSPAVCADIRALYDKDTALWETLRCGTRGVEEWPRG